MKDQILPTLGGQWIVEVHDCKGSLLHRQSEPMKSFVANFSRCIVRLGFRNQGSMRMFTLDLANPATGGVVGPPQASNVWFRWVGLQGSYSGIIVGSSGRAVQGTDNRLGTAYRPGGTTTLRLTHNRGTWISETKTAGTITERYQRTFTNNSGSALPVREIGFAPVFETPGAVQRPVLMIRDKLGTVAIVNNLTTLTVTYDLWTVR